MGIVALQTVMSFTANVRCVVSKMRHITMHNPLFSKPVEPKIQPAPAWFKLVLVIVELIAPALFAISPLMNWATGMGRYN